MMAKSVDGDEDVQLTQRCGMGKSYVMAVPQGPQVEGFVSSYSMARAANLQIAEVRLELQASHVKWTSADTLVDTSEAFGGDGDEDGVSDEALSSQADEAAVFEDVSLRGGSISALAALATKSRKASEIISHVSADIRNTLIE